MARPNLGELTAFTHDFADAMSTDNIYNKDVALMMMREREKPYDGGEKIREFVEYDADENDTTGGAVSRTGDFEYVEREAFDAVRFEPRYYVQTNVIFDADVAANGNSRTQFFNFVMAREMSARNRMRDRFARHMYQQGQGTLQINGYPDIFADDQTFGEIDRTKFPWWEGIVHGSDTARGFNLQDLADVIGDCSDGADKPSIGITSVLCWNSIENVANENQRHVNTELAALGFENIVYHGIPIIKDKHCDIDASDRHKIYFPNFNHLFLRPHQDFNMTVRDWKDMPNNLGAFSLIVWFGNITCNSSRRQGLYADIDPRP